MKTTHNHESIQAIATRLHAANAQYSAQYPGESGLRQPVHIVYGGAHLFQAQTVPKLGAIAQRMLPAYLLDAQELARIFALSDSLAGKVYARLLDKLAREPIEDFRLDFEDGYGYRADEEEDAHALAAAEQTALAMAAATLPPFFGLRIKPLNAELIARSLRTLQLYLTTLCERTNRQLPGNFVITLPKVMLTEQVTALAEVCAMLEEQLGLAHNSLHLELMIETPQALMNMSGEVPLLQWIAAAQGRCRGVHFGAFDPDNACGAGNVRRRDGLCLQ